MAKPKSLFPDRGTRAIDDPFEELAPPAPLAEPVVELCPNCGAEVLEVYCGDCGQKRGTLNLPIRELVAEYLGEVFHLEGQLIRTLLLLATKPGVATVDYLAGRRARYTSPVRLYIGSSLVFFGLVLLTQSVDSGYYQTTELLREDLARTTPRILFFMLPLFALGLKLAYVRSGRPLVHHIVFALHLGATGMLLFVVLLFVSTVYKLMWGAETAAPFEVGWIYLAGAAVLAAYQFVAMHVVYPEGPLRTVLKFWLLMLLVWPAAFVLGTILSASFRN